MGGRISHFNQPYGCRQIELSAEKHCSNNISRRQKKSLKWARCLRKKGSTCMGILLLAYIHPSPKRSKCVADFVCNREPYVPALRGAQIFVSSICRALRRVQPHQPLAVRPPPCQCSEGSTRDWRPSSACSCPTSGLRHAPEIIQNRLDLKVGCVWRQCESPISRQVTTICTRN